MTTDQILARIAIARRATPGPWSIKSVWTDKHSGADAVIGSTGQVVCQCDEHDGGLAGGQRNVDHIAANSPEAVIELCEELIEAQALNRCLDKVNEELLAARAEIERLKADNEWLHMRRGQLAIERDEARADRSRLDGELHGLTDKFGSEP